MANKKRKTNIRFIVTEEYQPLRVVSIWVWVFMVIGLCTQIVYNQVILPNPQATAADLSPPPQVTVLNSVSFGDSLALSKLLMLRLQAFDNQPGISIPFVHLDYDLLTAWLNTILNLDPRSNYPLLSAAKLYTIPKDPVRIRKMIDWVRVKYLENPAMRWEWMAHCMTIAKHHLQDPKLALEIAIDLKNTLPAGVAPSWVYQMEIFYREENNEYDSAATLMSNLLDSGKIEAPEEFLFLVDRLEKIFHRMLEDGQIKTEAEVIEKQNKIDELRKKYLELQQGVDK